MKAIVASMCMTRAAVEMTAKRVLDGVVATYVIRPIDVPVQDPAGNRFADGPELVEWFDTISPGRMVECYFTANGPEVTSAHFMVL